MITSARVATDSYRREAGLFKTLMHPARLAILEALRDGEQCVCHMEALLGYRQAYISQQLSVLREAGLIELRREGWNIFYHVSEPRVFAVLKAARGVLGLSATHAGLRSRLAARRANCHCPKCAPAAG